MVYSSNSSTLDEEIIQELAIVVVDENNNKIDYKTSDIELTYNREPGEQEVSVTYKGNEQYASSTAKLKIKIDKADNGDADKGLRTPAIIAIIAGAIILLGIIGFVIYRKNKQA